MVTSKRFRNYYGKNCNRTNIEEQARQFEKNCTCLLDDVLYQVISLTLRNLTSILFNWYALIGPRLSLNENDQLKNMTSGNDSISGSHYLVFKFLF